MAVISLEGVRFRAQHGFYEEEQLMGNDFELDILIDTDIARARADIDSADNNLKIFNTVNYETVYEICRLEMNEPKKLLEEVVSNILLRLKFQFKNMKAVQIKLKKLNPPLGGQVAFSAVMEARRFETLCSKCKKEQFVCYKEDKKRDGTCWCEQTDSRRSQVHPRTLEMLDAQHKGCLCEKCLKEFTG
jgi:7,8-dihydroneopterin aldolase/epimerase/oxygenase